MMVVSSIPGVITPAYAGIPVIDGANLGQNIMNVIESVAHT
ncbi:MAG: conjugal transfer protein TrbJ, partial [Janthinobacterium sp.]